EKKGEHKQETRPRRPVGGIPQPPPMLRGPRGLRKGRVVALSPRRGLRPTERTRRIQRFSKHARYVCSWHIADISPPSSDVRFWGQSGHCSQVPQCPLLTQSGHEWLRIAAVQ